MSQQQGQFSANGSGAGVVARGKVLLIGEGTFGSGTLDLEAQWPDDTWHAIGAGITADGVISYEVPHGEELTVRSTLSGATTPTVDYLLIAGESA